MRQWENSRWNHIFTYVFHLALHRSGALSSCPVGLIPSCFIDASLCFQLTWYQHLVSKNSLVRTSIIQPSLPKGQAERDQSIWRHAGAGGIICQCVCVFVCCCILWWAEQGGRRRLNALGGSVERKSRRPCLLWGTTTGCSETKC